MAMSCRLRPIRASLLGVLLVTSLAPPLRGQANLVTFAFSDQSSAAAALAPTSFTSHLSVGSLTVSDGAFTSTNFTTGSPPDAPAVADGGGWTSATPAKYFAF